MYPSRYRLPEVTAHVVAALERRREGHPEWNDEVEAKLTADARAVLAEAGQQFAEVADDRPYWQGLERTLLEVALPRYLQLAKAEHAAARRGHGLWRGGDLVSRAAYAVGGLVVAAVVWRAGLPKWLEPLPLAFFIGGPLIPDLQLWYARRAFRAKLRGLVESMRDEAAARAQYRPLTEGAPAAVDEAGAREAAATVKTKTSEGTR